MKTFIRRPGNKTKHLKHIIPLLPKEYNTYIEPFVGTGALFLHLLPEKWIINDLNKDVANIWKLVRDDPKYMISEIDKFKKKFSHLDNDAKLKMCKKITSGLDNLKGKKRTIMYLIMVYCSYTGIVTDKFNGLNRNYMRGSYNMFSENYRIKIIDLTELMKFGEVYSDDYVKVLQKVKKGDFVFLDPPYIEEKDYNFKYNKDEILDDKFLKNLEISVEKLNRKQVKWMMTQADTPTIRKIFSKYKISKYDVNNGISKSKRCELIIMNY